MPSSTDQVVRTWAEQIRNGEIRAISRAITAIEDHAPEAEPLLQALFPHTGGAYLTGITGAPGTGKSTLVDRLAAHYRQQDQRVGIVAVDPTSPYTGGAILGDRIRMQRHAGDNGIFIRSMATRGFLGGLSRATAEVALLLDAAGKRQILIETVGVGQDEVDIVRLADCVLVVLVPGLGDDIQNMKAGLMEIGDIFVLNKADREGADRLEEQLHAMLALWCPETAGIRWSFAPSPPTTKASRRSPPPSPSFAPISNRAPNVRENTPNTGATGFSNSSRPASSIESSMRQAGKRPSTSLPATSPNGAKTPSPP